MLGEMARPCGFQRTLPDDRLRLKLVQPQRAKPHLRVSKTPTCFQRKYLVFQRLEQFRPSKPLRMVHSKPFPKAPFRQLDILLLQRCAEGIFSHLLLIR